MGRAADERFVTRIEPLDEPTLIRMRDIAHALWSTVKDAMVEIEQPATLALCALLAEGHLLIEDVPGVGKTTLAKAVARAIGGHDSRIQCTADLNSRSVLGHEVETRKLGVIDAEFLPGPIFANAVVFDEFNRATPLIQSALLEALEERAVTIGKRRHKLPRPFYCIATMNPHDNTGTFSMAQASCDRFAIRTGIGYASESGELNLINRFANPAKHSEIDPVVAPGDVVVLQSQVARIPAPEAVMAYLVRLLRSTREHEDVLVGASPRAMISTFRACQAAALLDNSAEVAVRHIRSLFIPCIAHRLRTDAGVSARSVCEDVLEKTPVPVTATPPSIPETVAYDYDDILAA